MAITDTQKVDYLWKKLGYGATKSDLNSNKFAPNEAIASPLLINGANTWNQASSIPTVLPDSSQGVVTVYPTSSPRETTADGTATANRTWKTGLIDWIPPEIGSTYQVKVYIHTASDAGNAASAGDQVFATGSGNNDEWFFDYQSGVLHFIGTNLPNGISFTGKSVYIAGGRYTGQKGLQNISGGGGSGLTFVGDDSAGIEIADGGSVYIQGGTGIQTSANSDGTITITNTGATDTSSFTFVGDDSVGTTLNSGETLQLEGDNKIAVVVEEDSTIGNSRVKFTTTTTFTQDSAPTGAKDGDRWFDTDSGNEYVYVVEGSSAHWIETGTSGSTINVSQLDSVDSILFAVDDSGSTSAATSETLSILGDGRISTDVGGDKEIRITTTAANVETGDSAPSNPRDGDLWYNSSNGNAYIYLEEGATAFWVQLDA